MYDILLRYSYYSDDLKHILLLQVLVPAISALVYGIIFGCVVKSMYEKKGYDGNRGFWLGFFLGVIGVIIAASKPDVSQRYNHQATDDYVRKLQGLNSSKPLGQRTIQTLSTGEWICPRCNKINASYVGTCACGGTRREYEAQKKAKETPKPAITESSEPKPVDPVQKIKEYKELLDMGAITQEEYDKKKAELLNM